MLHGRTKIELYNPTTETVNLSGMYLSDDANNLKLWQMPNNVGSVPAGGHLVVWLGSNEIKRNQAPFPSESTYNYITSSDFCQLLKPLVFFRKVCYN